MQSTRKDRKINMCVYVSVCVWAGGRTWWSPVSWWLRGVSQPWQGCHNHQLSSVREMTHSLLNKTCHTDRQTGQDRRWDRQAQRQNTPHVNILTPDLIGELSVSLQAAKYEEKAVGVIGLLQHGSKVNGLIWGLTPFKTNLRLCVIVPLTKFLAWSVQRFIVLLKETCCPAKGHLMVFQPISITLMYRRSKDKTSTSADEGEKPWRFLDVLSEKSIWVPTVSNDYHLVKY